MKNARKLIPALAMLLVSAILMTTASYAWFSMNTTVEATGMQVITKAPEGIFISDGPTAWSASSTIGWTDAILNPTYTTDVTNWYVGKSTAPNLVGDDAAATAVSANKLAACSETATGSGIFAVDGKSYYCMDQVYLSASAETDKVNAVVNFGTTTKSQGAARVAIKVGSTITVFSPADGTAEKVITTTALADYNEADVKATPTEGTLVQIFVFFDGTDASCYTNNLSTDAVNITVTFSALFAV